MFICVLCHQFMWINSDSEVILTLMSIELKFKVISEYYYYYYYNSNYTRIVLDPAKGAYECLYIIRANILRLFSNL
jgi:hypothetical protein